IFARGVEVCLDTKLEELLHANGVVTGVRASNFGRHYDIGARHGVVLACGGFEWNQDLRDRFFTVPTLTRYTSTPEDANRGEGLLAGLKVGAATEHTESGWGVPPLKIPPPPGPNFEKNHQGPF